MSDLDYCTQTYRLQRNPFIEVSYVDSGRKCIVNTRQIYTIDQIENCMGAWMVRIQLNNGDNVVIKESYDMIRGLLF